MKSTSDLLKLFKHKNDWDDKTNSYSTRTWIMELFMQLISNGTLLPCGAPKYIKQKQPLLDDHILCLSHSENLLDKQKNPLINLWKNLIKELSKNTFLIERPHIHQKQMTLNGAPVKLVDFPIKNGNTTICVFNGHSNDISSFLLIEIGKLNRQKETVAHIVGRLIVHCNLDKKEMDNIIKKNHSRILYIQKEDKKKTSYIVVTAHIQKSNHGVKIDSNT